MKKYNVNELISFIKVFRKILYKRFGDIEVEVYAFYQKFSKRIFSIEEDSEDSIILEPHFCKVYAAICELESLYFANDTIDAFDVIHKEAGDQIEKLSRSDFIEERRKFFQNKGEKKNGRKIPTSVLYFSKNILEHIRNNNDEQLFAESIPRNDAIRQLEDIYSGMKKSGYVLTEDISVKEFNRDIIEPLYPNLNEKNQAHIWNLFKNKDSSR